VPLWGWIHDVAPDGAVAGALGDALARLPAGANENARHALEDAQRSDVRFALAYAAARDVLATLDPRGAITLVEPSLTGPRLRRIESPCGFPARPTLPRDPPLLALDGRGHVCCTSLPDAETAAPRAAACADLTAASPAWRPLTPASTAVYSGEGAIALVDDGTARCLEGGEPASVRPVDALGLGPGARVRALSCGARGAAIAAVNECSAPGAHVDGAVRGGCALADQPVGREHERAHAAHRAGGGLAGGGVSSPARPALRSGGAHRQRAGGGDGAGALRGAGSGERGRPAHSGRGAGGATVR
jgi:hypothetical protein